MATKKTTEPRTESLPNHDGDTFHVGDGVHWGFNGDRDPGTVLYVSADGRKVYVSDDEYVITDNQGGYVEGDRRCDFTTVMLPLERCTVWTLRRDGRFTREAGKHSRSLLAGRCYARNPSF